MSAGSLRIKLPGSEAPPYMRAMSHAARVPFPAIANKVGPKKCSASQVGVGRDAHVQDVHHNA